jgi:hypothetical protein
MQPLNSTETVPAWWLELVTDEPYLYLFGPFETVEEAESAISKHKADLMSEGWHVMTSKVTRKGPVEAVLVA